MYSFIIIIIIFTPGKYDDLTVDELIAMNTKGWAKDVID
jgi:hypothetical protein